jgi:hypothetical protein
MMESDLEMDMGKGSDCLGVNSKAVEPHHSLSDLTVKVVWPTSCNSAADSYLVSLLARLIHVDGVRRQEVIGQCGRDRRDSATQWYYMSSLLTDCIRVSLVVIISSRMV